MLLPLLAAELDEDDPKRNENIFIYIGGGKRPVVTHVFIILSESEMKRISDSRGQTR